MLTQLGKLEKQEKNILHDLLVILKIESGFQLIFLDLVEYFGSEDTNELIKTLVFFFVTSKYHSTQII